MLTSGGTLRRERQASAKRHTGSSRRRSIASVVSCTAVAFALVAGRFAAPPPLMERQTAHASRDVTGRLDTLVARMRTGAVSAAGVATLLGGRLNGSTAPWTVRSTWPGVVTARLNELTHVGIDLAVDLEFTRAGAPRVAALERRFGPARPMPHPPDSTDPRDPVAMYSQSPGSPFLVRIFARVEHDGSGLATAVHVDRVRQ